MPGAVWKRFNWLNELVIPVVAAAMCAAWVTPLVYLLLHNIIIVPAGPRFPAGLVLGLLLGGTLVDRVVRAQSGGRVRSLVVGLLVTIGVNAVLYGFAPGDPGGWLKDWFAAVTDLTLGIHPVLVTIPLTAGLWAAGALAAWDDYDAVWTAFRWGVAGLAISLLLAPYVASEMMQELATAVPAFLGWGLLALALRSVARALLVERPVGGRAGLSRQWLAVAMLVIAVLVLGGWMLGRAAFLGVVSAVFAVLWPAIRWLLQIVAYLLGGVVYLFALLLRPLGTGIESGDAESLRPRFEAPSDLPQQVQQLSGSQDHIALPGNAPGIIVVVVVLAVAVGLLVLAWRRKGRAHRGEVEESRDSVLTPDLLLDQLRGLWRRRPRVAVPDPFLSLQGEEGTRLAVRRIYREFLALARRWGRPHRPGQTPMALEGSLVSLAPQVDDSLNTLTRAYVTARYSPRAPSEAEVAAAEAAMAQITAALAAAAPPEASPSDGDAPDATATMSA